MKAGSLRYDIMDELGPADVKKASDIIVHSDDERKPDYKEWWNRVYDDGYDIVIVATKDISSLANPGLFLNDMTELIENVSSLKYGEEIYSDIQVVSPNASVIAKFPDGSVEYEPSNRETGIITPTSQQSMSFKIGLKKLSSPKKNILAFGNISASIYSFLMSFDSATWFEVFPRVANGLMPDDESQYVFPYKICDSSGRSDNSFGPDFYYYKFKKDLFGDTIQLETEATVDELIRLGVVNPEDEEEVKTSLYNWAIRIVNR